ncbi:3-oxoadipate enol-lactonase [Amycolatopsis sulphurea]|uniref:3-oxoadipate enol-lactonase n=1 Tax=Amycolatopsis sulphurea TaxID=76022 RepID=A0A2A9FKR0_9PSEU|nr:alpha/beta hydrolase [Amycolatopsis sulphurea]PFG51039.1 3-oxoadipate enol-lactonase [Amycolatopsis sulphurea]
MTAELFVADTGEADLPAVVCLHSLFLDHTMFDDLVAAAAGRYRMVRPDFRGQGANPDAAGMVTMDDCADDILELLDRRHLGRVHLVAQSMGGDVAVRVAARRPDAVKRLVLLGTSARQEPVEHLDAFRPIADEVARSGFAGELLETITQIMFGETCRNDRDRAGIVARWRAHFGALRPGLAPAIRGVIERPSAVDQLPLIRATALVVSGGEDGARPLEWSQELVDGIPDAELWRLPTTGHSVILEEPALVIPRVLAFLDGEEAAR